MRGVVMRGVVMSRSGRGDRIVVARPSAVTSRTTLGGTLAATVILGATFALGACGRGDDAPFVRSIDEADLRADLFALAHDSMGGRLVGTPEVEGASDWIRDRFESLGLEPAGDDGTFDQRFSLVWFSLGSGDRLTVRGAGGARRAGNGWTPSNAGAAASAGGDVVFAGFGIVEPRLDYDDYRGESVRGKIVLVLEGEPGAADPASAFDGVVTSEASRSWRKVLAAQERGAAGVLFVRDVRSRPGPIDWPASHAALWPVDARRIERFTLGAWIEQIDIPAAQISTELAEALLSGTEKSLAELAEEADASVNGLGLAALPGARADLNTSVKRNVTPARNILAMVEGSDPALQNEVVIIGAHHDHNGFGPYTNSDGSTADAVFNGADDDGSGTVGVLAVAEAYARAVESGNGPRRSVIFAIWDAEERGLLGAWYYTTRPLFALQRTVANLNLDMIGRHEEVPLDGGRRFRGLEVQSAESNANAINILGYSRTPDLAATVAVANTSLAASGAIASELTLRSRYDNNASNLLRRSDHWPFLQNDVPAVWFHTGLHPDYHTPRDDAERIEYEKMTRIVRLVHQTSWDLANADGRPMILGMGSRPAG
jgi:peptidase M28-like protein